ncbi:Transposon Ty2-LR1 Gag-Pol polyprotein [Euphorbia peplus]|nr:Transposon Ty2-LR1 Gag-Pol polyprotein [Euphorbia peplus]
MATNNPLKPLLEKEKLTGTNFLDWARAVQIVLRHEAREYVLTTPIPDAPGARATAAVTQAYEKHVKDDREVACIMLGTMTAELQKQFMDQGARQMMTNLRTMFEDQARQERYLTTKALSNTVMQPGTSVSAHVLKMKGFIDRLASLNSAVLETTAVDMILSSLPPSFDSFILNYNMQGQDRTVMELHGLLKQAEQTMTKGRKVEVNVVSSGKANGPKNKNVFKNKGRKPAGKGKKKAFKPHPLDLCHECGEKGHWKSACPKLRGNVKNKQAAGSSGIYVVEINLTISSSWVLDTGCGSHICSNVQGLRNRRSLSSGDVDLRVGNGARVHALDVGDYYLCLPTGLELILRNCYHVPAMRRNIISVSCLDDLGFSFNIMHGTFSILCGNILYGTGVLQNGLYVLDLSNQSHVYNVNKRIKISDYNNPTYVWHCRLGHINERRIAELHSSGILGSFDLQALDTCESCLRGKMTKALFKKTGERSTELLGLIHSDVCGPMSTQARQGFQYFITFTDDYSRFGYVYLMRHKSETLQKFKDFKNEVENQLGKKIKALRSDRGGEYLSQEFDEFLSECGIVSQLTPPGTPQWNGVSERRNRTLLDMVRSMMSQANLPISFWGYALETAAYILNNTPSKAVKGTPYELWKGRKPCVSFMKIWGCDAHVKKLISSKLESRTVKCQFVGYPKETKGYYFYNPLENKVFVARTGVFLEKDFISKKDSGSSIELGEVQEPQTPAATAEEAETIVPDVQVDEQVEHIVREPRRSGRSRQGPERYGYLVTQDEEIMVVEQDDPKSYKEAIEGPQSDKWRGAMESEMQSMYDNEVWRLVDPFPGVKVVESMWLFKLKADNTFKGRLVAKGFRQIHGIDYDETFSPVAMLKSIRTLLAIAAWYDYEIWQMDVKTAFLNGELEEDVYMAQPEGFVNPEYPNRICKLQKSIYGLKQASRSWNKKFNESIKEFGFIQNLDEPCVYRKNSGSSDTFLVLYVDDILLIGGNISELQATKQWLNKCFAMKDLGEAETILGIRIHRDRAQRLLGLSQAKYIDKILKRFNMSNSKKGFIPMAHGLKLSKKEHSPKTEKERRKVSKYPYASAIWSIMYAMLCTRPDVAFALSMTSRFQSCFGEKHWKAVKAILKYLRRTRDLFLVYGGDDELAVSSYTDSGFQTDQDEQQSQSGFVFLLNGGAISWKSTKQPTVADSTAEAEYIAACEASKEAVWMRKFISDLGVVPSIQDSVVLFCDNNGAMIQAKEPQSTKKNQHVLRKFHLIREIIQRGDVRLQRVDTDNNVADPMTKALAER